MKKPSPPAGRRPGPRPRLNQPVKFSTQLTVTDRDALFAFAVRQGVSVAEATRAAIRAMVAAEQGH
jgi:hypothetical protein